MYRSSSQGFNKRTPLTRSTSNSSEKRNVLIKSKSLSRINTADTAQSAHVKQTDPKMDGSPKSKIPRSRNSYKQIKIQAMALKEQKVQPELTPAKRANSLKRRSRPPVSMNNMNVRANQVIRQNKPTAPRPLSKSKSSHTSLSHVNMSQNTTKTLQHVRPNRASQLRKSKSENAFPEQAIFKSWSSDTLTKKSVQRKGKNVFKPLQRRCSYDYSDYSLSYSYNSR